jgi:hypothetical protein
VRSPDEPAYGWVLFVRCPPGVHLTDSRQEKLTTENTRHRTTRPKAERAETSARS